MTAYSRAFNPSDGHEFLPNSDAEMEEVAKAATGDQRFDPGSDAVAVHGERKFGEQRQGGGA